MLAIAVLMCAGGMVLAFFAGREVERERSQVARVFVRTTSGIAGSIYGIKAGVSEVVVTPAGSERVFPYVIPLFDDRAKPPSAAR